MVMVMVIVMALAMVMVMALVIIGDGGGDDAMFIAMAIDMRVWMMSYRDCSSTRMAIQ